MNPLQKLDRHPSLLCVGLDSDLRRLPERFLQHATPQFAFNQWIVEQTHAVTAAYKINSAFYEERGAAGWQEMQLTLDWLRSEHPNQFTIVDAKRADIGNTSQAYAHAFFDELGADAVTLHPWLGKEALEPFLTRKDKVSIVLCKTSNVGAAEIQDLEVAGRPLWLHLAQHICEEWNAQKNCMLVMGASRPDAMAQLREMDAEIPLLIPGIGAQGGDLSAVLAAGRSSAGKGLLINSSREIIFAPNPQRAAEQLAERCFLF